MFETPICTLFFVFFTLTRVAASSMKDLIVLNQLAYAFPFKHVLFSKVKYKKDHYLSGVLVGIPAVS